MNVEDLSKNALAVAAVASRAYITNVLKDQPQWPCGFAWVDLPKVRSNSKIGKTLISSGTASKRYDGPGLRVWDPAKTPSQNMYAKFAGAAAFAEVFNANGIEAIADCRMD